MCREAKVWTKAVPGTQYLGFTTCRCTGVAAGFRQLDIRHDTPHFADKNELICAPTKHLLNLAFGRAAYQCSHLSELCRVQITQCKEVEPQRSVALTEM